jgi:hypothetical protein
MDMWERAGYIDGERLFSVYHESLQATRRHIAMKKRPQREPGPVGNRFAAFRHRADQETPATR